MDLTTERLIVRDWSEDDAEAALAIYGTADVTRWLTPAMDRVTDAAAMRSVLQAWQQAQPNLVPPRGRWAVQRKE
ncbi:GNAT family N-acetyltransferase, partial [Amycolatopsis alba DSM 44262]